MALSQGEVPRDNIPGRNSIGGTHRNGGEGVARVAGRELTIAAQAGERADPVHPPPEAARVTHPLGAAEDMVTGPKAGLPGCLRAASLLEGLRGRLLLLPLPHGARKMVQYLLQWIGRARASGTLT